MNCRSLLTVILVSCATASLSQESLPPASSPYFRVRYEPSSNPGELVYGVSYTVWIPPGVKVVRGIIVHQHGCGEGACKAGRTAAFDWHWQALAQKHECALLGPSYEQPEKENCSLWCDPRNGSEKKFLGALIDLATVSGHPELATAPWALWGHSGGATWVGTMLMRHPERVAAAWLRSGFPPLVPRKDSTLPAMEIPAAALAVPVMCNLGTKEGVTEKEGRFAGVWEPTQAFFLKFRGMGGLIGVAVDPQSSHDCGNSRYLAMPWFDVCLGLRLPERAGGPLRLMPERGGWLASLLGSAAQPEDQFKGDLKTAVWLPDARTGRAWAEYAKDSQVADSTAPPAPTNVKVNAAGEITWQSLADLESGLAAFIIEREGQAIGQVPEKPAGSIGRKVVQVIGYSDTPTPPLVEMRFTDTTLKAGEKPAYRVIAVNSVGLISMPSEIAVAP